MVGFGVLAVNVALVNVTGVNNLWLQFGGLALVIPALVVGIRDR